MRITEAAQALGTSPRMLRYRESLGLLPLGHQRRSRGDGAGRLRAGRDNVGRDGAGRDGVGRDRAGRDEAGQQRAGRGAWDRADRDAARRESRRAAGPGAAHRQFTDADLAAAALALSIERRYDISPAALAFGIRVLADPRVRSEVAELGRRIGRIQAPPARALDFEQERALRLLRMDQQASPAATHSAPTRPAKASDSTSIGPRWPSGERRSRAGVVGSDHDRDR